jgi:GxxExxY protein
LVGSLCALRVPGGKWYGFSPRSTRRARRRKSTYQACLAYELRRRGIEVGCEVALPVSYGEIEVEIGYHIDMLVACCVIIENKSVQAMPPLYEAQLLTYLKLSGHRLGFLMNCSLQLIKDGIKRMVNGF